MGKGLGPAHHRAPTLCISVPKVLPSNLAASCKDPDEHAEHLVPIMPHRKPKARTNYGGAATAGSQEQIANPESRGTAVESWKEVGRK